ncbi:hypothetical protein gpAD87_21460 [Paenibacillus sp. AD87]|nr:hypothetical protein gpAD87_21460 [Paenibacillus sp. AD87]
MLILLNVFGKPKSKCFQQYYFVIEIVYCCIKKLWSNLSALGVREVTRSFFDMGILKQQTESSFQMCYRCKILNGVLPVFMNQCGDGAFGNQLTLHGDKIRMPDVKFMLWE